MRRGIGVAVAALGLGIIGIVATGAGQVVTTQERPALRVGPDVTPRSRAAQEIVAVLRGQVEADPQQIIAELLPVGELAERRRQVAEQLMEFALVKFLEPPSPTAERGTFHAAIVDYVEWSSRRLDATLDLADSDDSRREAMAVEVAKMRRVEEIYRQAAAEEAVGVSPQNVLELEFRRLELESRLARLVGGGEG